VNIIGVLGSGIKQRSVYAHVSSLSSCESLIVAKRTAPGTIVEEVAMTVVGFIMLGITYIAFVEFGKN
jgi:hypothetical protein